MSSFLVFLPPLLLLPSSGTWGGGYYQNEPAASLTLPKDGSDLVILQFADMHYNNGRTTKCSDVSPAQLKYPCSDLNTTELLRLILLDEKPDFVVFTGDNIDGGALSASRAIEDWSSVLEATLPGTKWAAVEGNHDQQSTATRSQMMDMLSKLPDSVSTTGPSYIHGFGNYYIKINDPRTGSNAYNLYFLDSGDSSKIQAVQGYDWVWTDQQQWYLNISSRLKTEAGGVSPPAIAFFHICLPEYTDMISAKTPISGGQREECGSASIDSGLFTAFLEAGDVKIASVGHDHRNDYCGSWHGIELCYGGGAGFHAYGQVGLSRRARIFKLSSNGTIHTYKRTDPWLGGDGNGGLGKIDLEQLFPATSDHPLRTSNYTQSFWRPTAEQEGDD